jgi:hypothetical protein
MRFADQDEIVQGFAAFAYEAFGKGVTFRGIGRALFLTFDPV